MKMPPTLLLELSPKTCAVPILKIQSGYSIDRFSGTFTDSMLESNRVINVFSNLTGKDSQIGFYTADNKEKIPPRPGCYAWFVPLWIYKDDIDQWLDSVSDMLNFETNPKKDVKAKFHWDYVKLSVEKGETISIPTENRRTWTQLLSESKPRSELQRTLLAASLLLPPLYIGKTDNLKRRYNEHTNNSQSDKNLFRTRFDNYISEQNLSLSVDQLLFVCIEVAQHVEGSLKAVGVDESAFDLLIEKLLMQLSRPPFSER